jgi:phage recombination protein Bet
MNQVVKLNQSGVVAPWSSRQLDTIKRTVARDTNDDEFNLFIEYARVKGLDPFSRQVIAIVFSKDDVKKRQMTIITAQDGLRVMASRCGDYRPEETEPEYEYDPALKGATNPLGIVKCSVKLWKQDAKTAAWYPVNGSAYWDEFAPIKTDDRAYEWIGTGEFWTDRAGNPTNKEKKRKQLREGTNVADFQTLDDSGQWKKMPRNQIAKCARMQALRGGWPETFSGVYAQEEMDRAVAADLTASEMVEVEREQRRMKSIAMSDDEYPFVDHEGNLSFIPAGRYGDHIILTARNCSELSELDGVKSRNREGLNRFWARHKDDALSVNQELEKLRTALVRK